MFHMGHLIEITCHDDIKITQKKIWICFMDLNMLFITLNILAQQMIFHLSQQVSIIHINM